MLTPTPRNGFSMMETLVALLIVALLAAVMLPAVATRVSPSESAVLARNLQSINAGVLEYRENVGKYPHELLELTTRPTAGSSQDACQTTLSTTAVSLWSGPYLSLGVNSSGVQSGDALIANTIQRSPSSTSGSTVLNGVLQLSVSEVTSSIANDLESLLDTGNDLTIGTIVWTAGSSSTGTLTFGIPIRGC
jgi:prepilin-type N-terminal cleavage/methylation domain-containing protein